MPEQTPFLQIDQVVLASQERRLLDHVTATVSSTGITAIMGPNGAGKSLLLRCLHGLITPDQGNILWDGQPLSPEMIRRQSFVFQAPTLLRRTVRDNLIFVLKQRGNETQKAQAWLQKVGLQELADQPARLLSGGEKQRLALARAMLTAPEILFLDEATSNLDPASVQMIEAIALEAANNGTKVIIVTHDIGQARRLADEVLFLARGTVCEQTEATTFFSQPQSAEAEAYLNGRIVL